MKTFNTYKISLFHKLRLLFMFSILLFITFLTGCKKHDGSYAAIVDASEIPIDGIILKNWYLLGPFQSNGKVNYLNYDNLTAFKEAESSIDFKQLKEITNPTVTFNQERKLYYGIFNSKTHIVDFNEALSIYPVASISANIYAACVIYSDKKKKLRLDFTSDDGAKIWLNHKQILSIDKASSVHDYENYIELDLKKGNNFLLIKVYNGGYSWQMIAKLQNDSPEGMEQYKRTRNNLLNNNFLNKSIVDSTHTVELVKTISEQKRFIRIYDNKSQICYQDSIKRELDISSFKNGLYTICLDMNNITQRQNFYKGSIIKSINTIISKLSAMQLSSSVKNSIDAYTFRYKHLIKPQNVPKSFSERQLWQTKIISVYINLDNILGKIEKKENPIKNVPGFHIGTFISNIDNQVQYYLVNVPMNYDKSNKYPLMIFMPFIEDTHRPYLECVKMANQAVTDNFQRLADKYNVCVIRPLGREVDKPNFNSIFETDFFESLKAIKENYNIDTTRVYLTGSCSGGCKALKLATRYPGLFAAIGLVSPMFKTVSSNDELLVENEPFNHIENIKNIPTYILHSSVDIHSPVTSSDEFVEKAKSYNMHNIQYFRTDKILDLYYFEQHSDSVASFITKYKLNSQPRNISFSTNQLKYNTAYWFKITDKACGIAKVEINVNPVNKVNIISKNVNSFELDLEKMPYNKNLPLKVYENNKLIFNNTTKEKVLKFGSKNGNKLYKTTTVEGPFNDALIHSFIIVKGTIGTPTENRKISDLADSINAIWKFKYFNECRIKKDIEVTEKDIKNSNLVLLGNFTSNKILKQINNKIPLVINSSEITVGKEQVKGENLGFYLVYPNPLNSQRYVAIIGYNKEISLGSIDIGNSGYESKNNISEMNISCYGFYDYKVWNNSRQNYSTKKEGFFDNNWK